MISHKADFPDRLLKYILCAEKLRQKPVNRGDLYALALFPLLLFGACSISGATENDTPIDQSLNADIGSSAKQSKGLGPINTTKSSVAQRDTLKPLSGRRVYKRVCMACHTIDVWGAPKLGNRNAWKERVAKGKEALYFSAINGLGKMPPRGHCQFCTDDELKSTVDYMVSKAQLQKQTRNNKKR